MTTQITARYAMDDKALTITVEDGRVTKITRATGDSTPNNLYFAPPLFDIQVNGGKGVDLQSPNLTVEDVTRLDAYLASHGVGLWVPTLITGSSKTMARNCAVLADAMEDPWLRRRIPGIHLEGPHISPNDGPRGAHAKRFVRKPDIKQFDRLLEAARGKIIYTTIAPDQPGAIPFIRGVVRRGVTVSLGHHLADADSIARAADAGARLCTHLGNGLSATIHRHHNPLWPQLANDSLAASLIADLHHLTPEMLKTFTRMKGPDNIVLVSDCMPITGLKPGIYDLMGASCELTPQHRINLVGSDLLAGSALMLVEGVVNTWRETDMTLAQAIDSATRVPARILQHRARFAMPKVGAKAHFIVFRAGAKGKGVTKHVYLDGRKIR